MRVDRNTDINSFHNMDLNCLPRSVVTFEGMPKREIQCVTKALATVSASMSSSGTASGQRVNQSTMVNKYDYPLQVSSGPTRSI